MSLSRRSVLPLPLLGLISSPARAGDASLIEAIAEGIEQETGGRVGLALLDSDSGQSVSLRANERFAMCSTFKLALAGWLLHAADRGRLALDEPIAITAQDMVPHAPFSESRVGQHVSLMALAEAGVVSSDNPAANLLLRRLGGPQGLTEWVREQGDAVTRLDRYETMLNEGAPGDPRDTTSPAAMLALMQRLLLGDTLTPDSRQRVIGWMHGSETGNNLVRAGLPLGWQEGNKTGAGENGIRTIISLITPPGRRPILLCVFMAGVGETLAARNAHFPLLGRALAQLIA